jgi:cysteine desulfurase/selenocysteine lyase
MAMVKEVEPVDFGRIREQFPILRRLINGQSLCYLDNAATSQKPVEVIERVRRYYAQENANIHRGVHALSQEATEFYEAARRQVATFIGATEKETIFTRGATESINLVASSLAPTLKREGRPVLITQMEHHANIVPWQLLRDREGVDLVVVRVDDEGRLDRDDFSLKLRECKPGLVSLTHVCNSTGVVNPVEVLIEEAHGLGIPVLVDACQSVPHFPVDVRSLDCDWLVFSGHKVFGPTGIGVLYGKAALLEAMPPYQGGGDMIESVTFEKTIFKAPPERFEAGTPNVAGAIGLGAATQFVGRLDRQQLVDHETALRVAADEALATVPGLRIIAHGDPRAAVVSFVMDAAHPHDIASFLDAEGIAIRSGHHCTQPLMQRLGLSGTARASFSLYNTLEDVERLREALMRIHRFFG